ncbi:MAG: PD40 domain-containing protein [bacterium]|nr:PD40 domain-containing protein [bacterium]
MTIVRSLLIAGAFVCACVSSALAATPLLLQSPTISRTQVAFVYAGDIWTVPRSGGDARRLVTGYGLASAPYFSPDGSTIAFSANYDGNVDVYTVPAIGGEPTRVTYHPAPDIVIGWTPDGKRILFRSARNSPTDAMQVYEIAPRGGEASELPLPDANAGSFSADQSHFAYVPNGQWEPFWQGYRGGQTTPIWIANMADSSVTAIPRNNSNDRYPMWIGSTIYFVSDRNGNYTLFAYDTHARTVRQLVENHHGFDIVSASANDGEIVYSQFDAIHVYDPASHTDRNIPIAIHADLAEVRPHWESVGSQIQNGGISPSGVRAVFEAHGDIFTVPAQHGDIRDITRSPGVEERDPAWSPDGKWIAYFSDAGGEYALHLRDQRALQPEKVYELEPRPSFYYSPIWSPDSKKIAYTDKHLGVYYIDVSAEHPHAVKIASQPFESFGANRLDGAWSPDGRYFAYTQQLTNFEHAIVVYDTLERQAHQVTDGMSDATNPAFDRTGKYLYFLSSTNTALAAYGLDMESDNRPVTSSVYAAVLHASDASPIAPVSDEERVTSDEPEAAAPKPAAAKPAAKPAPTSHPIDFAGIGQRIVSLPIPDGNYTSLQAAEPGTIFLAQAPVVALGEGAEAQSLLRFDLTSRRVLPWAGGISGFVVSADGKKLLLGRAAPYGTAAWAIVSTATPPKANEGTLATGAMEMRVDPPAQWAQMYRETWRIERDYFYDPHHHGLDIAAAERRFAVFLPGLASRDDFTYLTHEMISYLSVGHLWVYGGSPPPMHDVHIGLLGADYEISDGHYRFAKIYDGENWNPQLHAPLTQPGVNVKPGEYLLAVNGTPVTTGREVYAYFEETAGKQTIIRVGPHADGSGARDVTVVPLASEANLRKLAWIEDNRRLVDRLSGGKLAYVYMPDTAFGGFTNFNRYFFAQVNREGVILDERYNHGGQIADYVIDLLGRKAHAIIKGRDGDTYLDPPLAIYGPKVMVINQYAGSGGDAMPWLFRKAGIGKLVGVRTWGGLVGIGGYPSLMDGGAVMAPRVAIGGLHGHWEVEGHGIAPDVTVVQDPKLVREGHDPQLEAAVRTAMDELRAHPLPHYLPPPYPNHHPVLPPQ